MSFLAAQPANYSFAAIDLDEIAVAKPLRNSWNGYNRGNPYFARDYGRVGKQAAALDDQASRCGKQHDPSGIGAFGHQNATGGQRCGARVCYHAHSTPHLARTRAQPSSFLPEAGQFFSLCLRLKLVSLVDGLVCLETVRRPGSIAHLLKFALAKSNEFLEIRRGCRPLNESEHLFDLEIEDVARILEQGQCAQPASDFYENAAHSSEYACSFEAKILPTANSLSCIPEHPIEGQAAKRTAAKVVTDLPLRSSARYVPLGRARYSQTLCEFTDAPQQQRGIIVQRGTF